MANVERQEDLLKLYIELRDLHLRIYQQLIQVQTELKASKYSLGEMVNVLHIVKELSRYAGDIRKECDGTSSIIEKVCCMLYVTLVDSGAFEGPIRTGLVTGTPQVRMAARIPNKRDDPEEYGKLMRYYGVNPDAVEADALRPHWPGMVAHLTQLASEGKPLPPGIKTDGTYPVYSVMLKSWQPLEIAIDKLQEMEASKHNDILMNRK